MMFLPWFHGGGLYIFNIAQPMPICVHLANQILPKSVVAK